MLITTDIVPETTCCSACKVLASEDHQFVLAIAIAAGNRRLFLPTEPLAAAVHSLPAMASCDRINFLSHTTELKDNEKVKLQNR